MGAKVKEEALRYRVGGRSVETLQGIIVGPDSVRMG